MNATRPAPRNPWMVALTVMWVLLLLVGLLILLAGAGYLVAGGVVCALSVLVVGLQLGVGAVRWYLDESSRFVPSAQSDRPRPARQDF